MNQIGCAQVLLQLAQQTPGLFAPQTLRSHHQAPGGRSIAGSAKHPRAAVQELPEASALASRAARSFMTHCKSAARNGRLLTGEPLTAPPFHF